MHNRATKFGVVAVAVLMCGGVAWGGLKDVYAGRFLVGVAGDLPQGWSERELGVVGENYGVVTPENCMKPASTHPAEGRWTFGRADRLVEWCEAHKMAVVGHCLVWHQQTPAWFFEGKDGGKVTREVAIERLKAHVQEEVAHFKGRIKGWDVVNEAIADGGGEGEEGLRKTPWLEAIGPGYLTMAFKFAHEADPGAELHYNDYGIESGAKHRHSMALLKRLIAEGSGITAVGIQGHWTLSPDYAGIERALLDYKGLGLKVMITELDVAVSGENSGRMPAAGGAGGATTEPVSEDLLRKQAEVYGKLFAIFNRHADVITRVTFWGTDDRRSWISRKSPLLFDREMKPKPAYEAVVEAGRGK